MEKKEFTANRTTRVNVEIWNDMLDITKRSRFTGLGELLSDVIFPYYKAIPPERLLKFLDDLVEGIKQHYDEDADSKLIEMIFDFKSLIPIIGDDKNTENIEEVDAEIPTSS